MELGFGYQLLVGIDNHPAKQKGILRIDRGPFRDAGIVDVAVFEALFRRSFSRFVGFQTGNPIAVEHNILARIPGNEIADLSEEGLVTQRDVPGPVYMDDIVL